VAGRPIGRRHQEDVRGKIQSSLLIKRLNDYAEGKLTLEQGQVNAIKILLGKVLPDLQAIGGDPYGEPVKQKLEIEFIKAK
jgi:hypothetical protein